MMNAGLRKFKLSLLQIFTGSDKRINVEHAIDKIQEVSKKGTNIIALPECFNSPYGVQYFEKYAEPVPGYTTNLLSNAAKSSNVYLVAGSIPEKDGNKLYNTCAIFNPKGELIAKHRKIPGTIEFQESQSLTPGDNFTVFKTPFCNVGVGICYDIRFSELANIYAKKDCDLIIYPGAFDLKLGPAHWELLVRARALDSQAYVAAVSAATNKEAFYAAYGHSCIADPFGKIIANAENDEKIVEAEIDLNYMSEIRKNLPTMKQKRNDLYDLVSKRKD